MRNLRGVAPFAATYSGPSHTVRIPYSISTGKLRKTANTARGRVPAFHRSRRTSNPVIIRIRTVTGINPKPQSLNLGKVKLRKAEIATRRFSDATSAEFSSLDPRFTPE